MISYIAVPAPSLFGSIVHFDGLAVVTAFVAFGPPRQAGHTGPAHTSSSPNHRRAAGGVPFSRVVEPTEGVVTGVPAVRAEV